MGIVIRLMPSPAIWRVPQLGLGLAGSIYRKIIVILLSISDHRDCLGIASSGQAGERTLRLGCWPFLHYKLNGYASYI